jgi:hypothetical protein
MLLLLHMQLVAPGRVSGRGPGGAQNSQTASTPQQKTLTMRTPCAWGSPGGRPANKIWVVCPPPPLPSHPDTTASTGTCR